MLKVELRSSNLKNPVFCLLLSLLLWSHSRSDHGDTWSIHQVSTESIMCAHFYGQFKETIGKNYNEKITALKQSTSGNDMFFHTVLHTKSSCMTSF